LLVVIGWIVQPIGLMWLGIPVVAAILVSARADSAIASLVERYPPFTLETSSVPL
jgi:hypothetical protein